MPIRLDTTCRTTSRSRSGRVGVLASAVVLLCCSVGVPVSDSAFTARVTNSTNSAQSASTITCTNSFTATTPATNSYFEYRLQDSASSTTATDLSASNNPGLYQGGHQTDSATPTACPADPSTLGYGLNGSSQYLTVTNGAATSPDTFTILVWFKTSVASGVLIGLSGSQTGSTSYYDRVLYFQASGQLSFAVYTSATQILTTPTGKSYADGIWHQAAVTFGPTQGSTIYVDGQAVAANSSMTAAQGAGGRYWRLGYVSINSDYTGGTAINPYFNGSMKFAAVYKYVRAATEIRAQYITGAPK